METVKLIADCVTAAATVLLAVAAWIQLPSISKQVKLLADQIEESRKADANSERRVREWETLKACGEYDYNPVLEEATQRVWLASEQGTNYLNGKVPQRDMINILNYLDGLATGIEQDLYIEAMIKDHLGPVFQHAYLSFIDTKLVEPDGLEKFCALYRKWYEPATPPSYRSGRTP